MEDIDKEDYRKPSGDEGEVVFSQQKHGAATLGPYGLTVDRQNENEWLDDTEPYNGARPRMMQEKRPTMDVDQVVDSVLGATGGTTGQNMGFHDTPAPTLPPEQQIRQEGEIRTPPRREPRRDGGQRPKELRLPYMGGATLAPGSFADQGMETAGRNRQSDEWSPVIALENTVLRMQRDLENRFLRTPKPPAVAPLVRQAAPTMTKVPWFNGLTSWEQYQQVFDAIVLSNGWDDATAALQLLSHLQGDTLNVALLIPMPRRASRKELTDALSAHYGSPGRLANYRREFDKTVRKPGEDPSNFAIALETLAVKAFDDMGQAARLRLIRDRFIAGHGWKL